MDHLFWLLVLPFFFSGILFCFPSFQKVKMIAIILSLIPLALLLGFHNYWIGTSFSAGWLTPLSINLAFHIDSVSLLFLYLTALVIPISLFALPPEGNNKGICGWAFLLEGLLFCFFCSNDLVMFTIFWEAMLLPLYFIITAYGKEKKKAAGLKFLIYMIAGSSLMIAGVLGLYVNSGSQGNPTFNLMIISENASNIAFPSWLFGLLILAFAVKTPLFPFHGWLPDAYYQAPASGTILLSAILSKAGIYGFWKIGIGIFPHHMKLFGPWLLGLALVGVFYGALAAWRQLDFKRLIAYSSFSHVNFILIGLFIWNQTAHSGALLQAFNHGITIAALFMIAAWLEQRLGTTSLETTQVGGLAKLVPWLCWSTLIFVLSSVALPGTNNFVGELMILFGIFTQNGWLAALLGISVILSAVYMLRFMQKIYFGPLNKTSYLNDLNNKEFLVVLPIVALIIWIGVYPTSFLKLTDSKKPAISWSQE